MWTIVVSYFKGLVRREKMDDSNFSSIKQNLPSCIMWFSFKNVDPLFIYYCFHGLLVSKSFWVTESNPGSSRSTGSQYQTCVVALKATCRWVRGSKLVTSFDLNNWVIFFLFILMLLCVLTLICHIFLCWFWLSLSFLIGFWCNFVRVMGSHSSMLFIYKWIRIYLS